MPHWLVYHPPSAYADDESKDALVKAVTDFYLGIGLPAFYVVINFIKVAHEDFYVGGARRGPDDKPFVRFTINHVAHNYPDDDQIKREAGDAFNQLLTPLMKGKYDWEFHISETDRRLWKINGFTPPEEDSEGQELWAKENSPVPY